MTQLNIAVQGCSHGELSRIYDECRKYENSNNCKIDLLICCGDFQSIRTPEDYKSISIPVKYRKMGDFHLYHGGTRTAPITTLFIGGNHEVSSVLWEEYYGGPVAPNIYYLGHSGVVTFNGLRIAGLSGIFKPGDFEKSYPVPPYTNESVQSAYHVRSLEIKKLELYCKEMHKISKENKIDIMLSHDWPMGITEYGNEESLLIKKPYFRDDIRHKRFGNPHTLSLLNLMHPIYWFASHHHVYFEAMVPNNLSSESQPTKFIALDKCINRPFEDSFLCVKTFNVNSKINDNDINKIIRDPLWCAIIQRTHYALKFEVNYPLKRNILGTLIESNEIIEAMNNESYEKNKYISTKSLIFEGSIGLPKKIDKKYK